KRDQVVVPRNRGLRIDHANATFGIPASQTKDRQELYDLPHKTERSCRLVRISHPPAWEVNPCCGCDILVFGISGTTRHSCRHLSAARTHSGGDNGARDAYRSSMQGMSGAVSA